MEIKVEERTKNRVVMDIEGADHTFCNVLKKELWNDDAVKSSAYNVDHPLVGEPRLVVQVKRGNDVAEVISDAVERIEDKNDDFLKSFKKAM